MISSTATTIFMRAIAFAGTAVFSLALMNSLPRVRQQRQRSFVEATLDGNVSRMRWLRLAGAKVDARSNLGNPLSLAAAEGKLDAVRYLLDQGAKVNTSEMQGHAALAEAAYYGHVDVVKELLLHGADINAVSADGTALDIAVSRKNSDAADLLKHWGGKTVREIHPGG
jgi:ankyrin repeat protein